MRKNYLWLPTQSVTTLVVTFSAVSALAIAIFDYATGTEVRILPIYFMPITLCAWHCRMPWVILIAGFSTAARTVSLNASGVHYSHFLFWVSNAGILFLTLALYGWIISVLQRRIREEREAGMLDVLTGLGNRRAFIQQAKLVLEAAGKLGRFTTIAYVDLDNFKSINDTLGHAKGDDILREAGSFLRRHTRGTDFVARLGGDEFAILMAETGRPEALAILERFRTDLEGAMRKSGLDVTASIGALTFREESDPEVALSHADAFMYVSKRSGKNQVYIEERG